MISNIIHACLNPLVGSKKRRVTRLSRSVMQVKRRDDRAVLNTKLAFAHLGLGRTLSYFPDAGNHLDPLERELKLALECYERAGSEDGEEYHRLRSILHQGAAKVTMRMARRTGSKELCDIAQQRLDSAAESAHLARNPNQQARVRTLWYELGQIMERPRIASMRTA